MKHVRWTFVAAILVCQLFSVSALADYYGVMGDSVTGAMYPDSVESRVATGEKAAIGVSSNAAVIASNMVAIENNSAVIASNTASISNLEEAISHISFEEVDPVFSSVFSFVEWTVNESSISVDVDNNVMRFNVFCSVTNPPDFDFVPNVDYSLDAGETWASWGNWDSERIYNSDHRSIGILCSGEVPEGYDPETSVLLIKFSVNPGDSGVFAGRVFSYSYDDIDFGADRLVTAYEASGLARAELESHNFNSLQLNGSTISNWNEISAQADTNAIISAVGAHNFESLTLNNDTITVWPSGGGGGDYIPAILYSNEVKVGRVTLRSGTNYAFPYGINFTNTPNSNNSAVNEYPGIWTEGSSAYGTNLVVNSTGFVYIYGKDGAGIAIGKDGVPTGSEPFYRTFGAGISTFSGIALSNPDNGLMYQLITNWNGLTNYGYVKSDTISGLESRIAALESAVLYKHDITFRTEWDSESAYLSFSFYDYSDALYNTKESLSAAYSNKEFVATGNVMGQSAGQSSHRTGIMRFTVGDATPGDAWSGINSANTTWSFYPQEDDGSFFSATVVEVSKPPLAGDQPQENPNE